MLPLGSAVSPRKGSRTRRHESGRRDPKRIVVFLIDECGDRRNEHGHACCPNDGSDDTEETVKERLKVYFDQTAPLIDYYTQGGKLLAVDGQGEVDEVSRRIVTAIQEDGV